MYMYIELEENRMDREARFIELDNQIEKMSAEEQSFMLWQLLKKYADRIEIPERCDTIEDYRKEKVNHGLWVACNELIDMLSFELWR